MGVLILSLVMLKGVFASSVAWLAVATFAGAFIGLTLYPILDIGYFWWWMLFNAWFLAVGWRLHELGSRRWTWSDSGRTRLGSRDTRVGGDGGACTVARDLWPWRDRRREVDTGTEIPGRRQRLPVEERESQMPYVLLILVATAALASVGVVPRYRRDIGAARARLRSVRAETVQFDDGSVEFTDVGDGPVFLVSHGIFHGCDGGQRSARDVISDHRIISPSRFGYLGSSMPENPSGAAQADMFVHILDHLGIESVDVLGISAGTSAAVQLALRHPGRVGHLIVSSGNWPGSPTSEAPPDWAKAFYNDPTMWALRKVAPPMMKGLMGVPEGFPRDDQQSAYVEEMLDSIFPLGPRSEGAIFDAFVSNPEINDYPLEQVAVPTLIIHAKDDPLASYDAAVRATERIPDARIFGLDSGGHLGLGQTHRVREAIADFVGTPVN